jgi:hypothetical protein
MKIDGSGRIVPASPAKVARTGSGGTGQSFSNMVEGASESAPVAAPTSAQALSGIDALLGLQEVDDATERKARAKKRAGHLLDQLDDIRNCLLMGEMPPHQLNALRDRIAQEKVGVDDPRLATLLEEIDLRAEVELAKLEAAREEGMD